MDHLDHRISVAWLGDAMASCPWVVDRDLKVLEEPADKVGVDL